MDLHGGNIYRLIREGKKDIIDYSSNINPLGVPEIFKKKVIENFDILEKYPDPEYIELRESIGKYNKLGIENIVVGNGATEILFKYIQSTRPKKAVIIAPAFAEYTRALESIDCEIVHYELSPERNFHFDIDHFKQNIPQCDLVILCNPNNPTGSFMPLDKIQKINNILKVKKIKLFIDEAFIEFIKGWESLTAANLKDENTFIMRALTKFFAVPGVRLGYGIYFDTTLSEKLKKYIEPWSINSFADMAGKIMLEDKEYIEKTEDWIEKEKKWFYEETLNIPKIKSYNTNTNFILIKSLTHSAKVLKEKMLEKGILIRDASNFVGLDEHFIRLAIKDRDRNIKVLSALKEVIE